MTLLGHRGIQLAADTWGHAGDHPVLLLHGGGQTRHAWRRAGERLASSGFHAIALDLRGHGDSAWAPDGDYSLDAMVADVAAVVATLEARPALVGASLGGTVGLVAAGRDDPLCSTLVLVDIVPRVEREGAERIVSFMQGYPDGFESLEDAADAIGRYLPHRPRPRDLSGLAKNLRHGHDGRYRWHWDPRFLADSDRRVPRDRLLEAARRLQVPTLLVRGQMSDVVSMAGVNEFLTLAPHTEFVDVSNTGHMVAGDDNDAFIGAVTDFLIGVAREDGVGG